VWWGVGINGKLTLKPDVTEMFEIMPDSLMDVGMTE